jgi:hypothetical protein
MSNIFLSNHLYKYGVPETLPSLSELTSTLMMEAEFVPKILDFNAILTVDGPGRLHCIQLV